MVWYYQLLNNNHWNLDHPFERLFGRHRGGAGPDGRELDQPINLRVERREVRCPPAFRAGPPSSVRSTAPPASSCGAKPAVTRSDIISSIDSIDGATGVVSENSAVVFRNALDDME